MRKLTKEELINHYEMTSDPTGTNISGYEGCFRIVLAFLVTIIILIITLN